MSLGPAYLGGHVVLGPRVQGDIPSYDTGDYQIRTIENGKILVMLVYGEYYGQVYEVYNK